MPIPAGVPATFLECGAHRILLYEGCPGRIQNMWIRGTIRLHPNVNLIVISQYWARNNFETKTFTLVLLEHFSGKTVPLKLIKKSLKIYKKQLFFSHFFSYLISNGKLSKLV